MNFEEHAAKPVLRAAGIAVPGRRIARSGAEARTVATELGVPVVVKALVPAGKRGKASGTRAADNAAAAEAAAQAILGMDIAGHCVETVLIEERAEYYAAVLNDPHSKGPLVMFSPEGGMDIEEAAAVETGPGTPNAGRHRPRARPRIRTRPGSTSALELPRFRGRLICIFKPKDPVAILATHRTKKL